MSDIGTEGLGASASRGALITVVGQATRISLQLLGLIVLARLLSPVDYGLFGIVLAIIGIGEVFRDFGLSSAAIQATSVSAGQRSNLFWLNVAIGAVLTVLLFVLAPALAAFFGDSRLIDIARMLSLFFLISGIQTQYRAVLHRELRFGQLLTSEVVGQALGLALAIVLAILGAGYWALIYMQLTQAFVALAINVGAAKWHPGLYDRSAPVRPFLSYGIHLVGSQFLNYASRNVDTFVIGSQFGPGPFGLYNRAFQLQMLPLQQIQAPATRVALPTLARLQDDRKRFDDFLLHGQRVLTHFLIAAFSLTGALATPLILLVFGDQWLGSAPIFQILAVSGVVQVAAYSAYWVFLAKNLTRSNLRLGLVIRPMLVLLVLVGAFWGVLGVAWGYTIAQVLIWPITLWWLHRVSDAPTLVMFRRGLGVILVYATCGLAAWGCSIAVPVGILGQLAIGTGGFIVTFLVLVALIPALRADVRAVLNTRKYLRRRGSGGSAS